MMLICDECKNNVSSIAVHNVMLTPLQPRGNPLATVDLCKGCKPIFEKRITDLVRAIKRKK